MSGSVWDRALKYKGRQDGSVSEGTCQVWQDCFHAQNAHTGRRSDYCKFSLDLHIHIKMCMRLCVGMQACTHTRRKKGSKLAALAVIIIVTLSTVIITFLHLRLCFLEQRFFKVCSKGILEPLPSCRDSTRVFHSKGYISVNGRDSMYWIQKRLLQHAVIY